MVSGLRGRLVSRLRPRSSTRSGSNCAALEEPGTTDDESFRMIQTVETTLFLLK